MSIFYVLFLFLLEMSVYDNSKNMKLRLFIYSYIKNKLFLCSKYISTHQDQNYFLGKVIPLKIMAFKKYNFSWKLSLQYWFVQKLIDIKYFVFKNGKKVENFVIFMIFPHEILCWTMIKFKTWFYFISQLRAHIVWTPR